MDGRPEYRWTAVRLPFHPAETWPSLQKLRVRGTINGVAFRNSLIRLRDGTHLIFARQSVWKQAKAAPGSLVDIVIEPDLEDRSASPPPELAKLFRADRAVKKWFEKLTYSTRKYICDDVAMRKSAEATQRRAEHWVECLMLTMEGEIEPPPILQVAFRRQPQARVGWDAMTPIQRRTQLLAIFTCHGPESRQKRVDRAVADALRVATRRGRKAPSAEDEDGY